MRIFEPSQSFTMEGVQQFLRRRSRLEMLVFVACSSSFLAAYGISIILSVLGIPAFLSWPLLLALIASMTLNPELLALSVTKTLKVLRDNQLTQVAVVVERIDMRRLQVEKLFIKTNTLSLKIERLELSLQFGQGSPLKLTIESAVVQHQLGKDGTSNTPKVAKTSKTTRKSLKLIARMALWVSRFITIDLKNGHFEVKLSVSNRETRRKFDHSCQMSMKNMTFSVTPIVGVTNKALGFQSFPGRLLSSSSPSGNRSSSMGSQLTIELQESDVVLCSQSSKGAALTDKMLHIRDLYASTQVQDTDHAPRRRTSWALPGGDGVLRTRRLSAPVIPCTVEVNVSSLGVVACPRSIQSLALLDIAVRGPKPWHLGDQELPDGLTSTSEYSSGEDEAGTRVGRRKRHNTEENGWECEGCSYVNLNGVYQCQVCHMPSKEEPPPAPPSPVEENLADSDLNVPLPTEPGLWRPASLLAKRQQQVRANLKLISLMPFLTKIKIDTLSVDVSTYSHEDALAGGRGDATLSFVTSLGVSLRSTQVPVVVPDLASPARAPPGSPRSRTASSVSGTSSRTEASSSQSGLEDLGEAAAVANLSVEVRATDPLWSLKPTRDSAVTPFRVQSADSVLVQGGVSTVCRGGASAQVLQTADENLPRNLMEEEGTRYVLHHHTQLDLRVLLDDVETRYKPEIVEGLASFLYTFAETLDRCTASRRSLTRALQRSNGSFARVGATRRGEGQLQFCPQWLVTRSANLSCKLQRSAVKLNPTLRELAYETTFRELDTEELQKYQVLAEADDVTVRYTLNSDSPADPQAAPLDGTVSNVGLLMEGVLGYSEEESAVAMDRLVQSWARSAKGNARQLYFAHSNATSSGDGGTAPMSLWTLSSTARGLQLSLSSRTPGCARVAKRCGGELYRENIISLPSNKVVLSSLPSDAPGDRQRDAGHDGLESQSWGSRDDEVHQVSFAAYFGQLELDLCAVSMYRTLKLVQDIDAEIQQTLKPAMKFQSDSLQDIREQHRMLRNYRSESSASEGEARPTKFEVNRIQIELEEAVVGVSFGDGMGVKVELPRIQLIHNKNMETDSYETEMKNQNPSRQTAFSANSMRIGLSDNSLVHPKLLHIETISGGISDSSIFSLELCTVAVEVDRNVRLGEIILSALSERKAAEQLLRLLPKQTDDLLSDNEGMQRPNRPVLGSSEQYKRNNNAWDYEFQVKVRDVNIVMDQSLGPNEFPQHGTDHLLALQFRETNLRVLWDRINCSKKELLKTIRALDSQGVPSEVYTHGFSFASGCRIESFSVTGFELRIRDFEPIVQVSSVRADNATLVFAALAGTHACMGEFSVPLSAQPPFTISIRQSGAPVKLYWDSAPVQLESMRVVHGLFLSSSLAQVSTLLERLLPAGSDRVSPRLLWWDKLRYQYHGNFSFNVADLSVEVPSAPPWVAQHQRLAVTASAVKLGPGGTGFVAAHVLTQRFALDLRDVEVLMLVHGEPESSVVRAESDTESKEDLWPSLDRWSPLSRRNEKGNTSGSEGQREAASPQSGKEPFTGPVFEFLLVQLPRCTWELAVEWKGYRPEGGQPIHSKKELMQFRHNHYVQLHHSYAPGPAQVKDMYRLFRTSGASVFQKVVVHGELGAFPTLFACWSAYPFLCRYLKDRERYLPPPPGAPSAPSLLRFLDEMELALDVASPRVLWWENAHTEAAMLLYADRMGAQWRGSRRKEAGERWPLLSHKALVVECPACAGHFVERLLDTDFQTTSGSSAVLDGSGCGGDPWTCFETPPWLMNDEMGMDEFERKHEPFVMVPALLFTQGDWNQLVKNPKVFLGGPGGDDLENIGRPHIVMDELKLNWNIHVRDALFMVVGSIFYAIDHGNMESQSKEETANLNADNDSAAGESQQEGETSNNSEFGEAGSVVSSDTPAPVPPPLPPRPPEQTRRDSVSALRTANLGDSFYEQQTPRGHGENTSASLDEVNLNTTVTVDLRWAQIKLSTGTNIVLVAGEHTCIRILHGKSTEKAFGTTNNSKKPTALKEQLKDEIGFVLQKQIHVEVRNTHVFAAQGDASVSSRFQWVPELRPGDAICCVPVSVSPDRDVDAPVAAPTPDPRAPKVPPRHSFSAPVLDESSRKGFPDRSGPDVFAYLEGDVVKWSDSALRKLMLGSAALGTSAAGSMDAGGTADSRPETTSLKCVLRDSGFKFVDMTKGWVFKDPTIEWESPAQNLHVDIPILDIRLNSQEFFIVLSVVRDLLLVAPPPDYRLLVKSQQQGRRGGMNAAWDPEDVAAAAARLEKSGRDMKLLRNVVEEFHGKLAPNASSKVKSIKYRVGVGTLTLLGESAGQSDPGQSQVNAERFERVKVVVKRIEGNHSFMDDGGTSVHVEVQDLELVDCAPGWQAMQFDDGDDAQQVIRGEPLDDFNHTPLLDTPIFTLDAVTSAPLAVGGFLVNTYEFLQFHIFPAANYQLNVRLTQTVASFLTRYFATDDDAAETSATVAEKDERVRSSVMKMGLRFSTGGRRGKLDASPTPRSLKLTPPPEHLSLAPPARTDSDNGEHSQDSKQSRLDSHSLSPTRMDHLKVDPQGALPQFSSKLKRTINAFSAARGATGSPLSDRAPGDGAGSPSSAPNDNVPSSDDSDGQEQDLVGEGRTKGRRGRHRRTVSADGGLEQRDSLGGATSPEPTEGLPSPREPVGFHGTRAGKGKDVIYMGWVSKRTRNHATWSGGRVRKNLVALRVKNPALPATTRSLVQAVVLEYYRSELEFRLKLHPRGSFPLRDVLRVSFTADASAPRHALDILVRVPAGYAGESGQDDECVFTFSVEPASTGQGYEESALDFVAQLYGLVRPEVISHELTKVIKGSNVKRSRLDHIVAATKVSIEERRLRLTSTDNKDEDEVDSLTRRQYRVTARRQSDFGDEILEPSVDLQRIVFFKYARVGDIRLLLSCQGFPLNVNRRIASCPALVFNARLWTWNQFFRRLRRKMVLKLIPSILKWQKQKATNRLGNLQESLMSAPSRRMRGSDSSAVAGPLVKGMGRIRGRLLGKFRRQSSMEHSGMQDEASAQLSPPTGPKQGIAEAAAPLSSDSEESQRVESSQVQRADYLGAEDIALQAMLVSTSNVVVDGALEPEEAQELIAAGIDVKNLYGGDEEPGRAGHAAADGPGGTRDARTLSQSSESKEGKLAARLKFSGGELSPKKSLVGIASAAISAGNKLMASHHLRSETQGTNVDGAANTLEEEEPKQTSEF